MTHYKSNLRDLEFNLFEVFGADQAFGQAPYDEIDAETARDVSPRSTVSRPRISRRATRGRPQPAVFDPATHTAPLPESFKKSFATWMAAEFWRLDLPSELGRHAGAAGPVVVARRAGARRERPVWMYSSGPPSRTWCTPRARRAEEWAKALRREAVGLDHGASPSPDAGSDVGAGRPAPSRSRRLVAHRGREAVHHLGEHDLTDNIIHYVLARPVGVEGVGGPGTKGLSLFIVPKYHFDARPASWASATASTPPTSSTRWASRSPTPAR
jgi:hypothetical protein